MTKSIIGLDSLHALQIRLELLPVIKGLDPTTVPRNLVYQYSTISQLVEYVEICRRGGSGIVLNSVDKAARINNCLQRFTEIPYNPMTDRSPTSQVTESSIILTGATGSLGCHILQELLMSTDTEKILCFHRGSPEAALQRQIEVFKQRNLPVNLLQENLHRLEFVFADLSLPSLGLKPDILDFVCLTSHIFIHVSDICPDPLTSDSHNPYRVGAEF